MNKLKLICVFVLLTFNGISCNDTSSCGQESLCQQQNNKISNAIAQLNNIGQKIHCKENIPEINGQVESVLDKIESSEELATLASISRAFQVYGSNEAPTCKTSRADNVFDQAYWICVTKLAKSPDEKSKEYLKKLKESSFFDSTENQHFQEVLNNK